MPYAAPALKVSLGLVASFVASRAGVNAIDSCSSAINASSARRCISCSAEIVLLSYCCFCRI